MWWSSAGAAGLPAAPHPQRIPNARSATKRIEVLQTFARGCNRAMLEFGWGAAPARPVVIIPQDVAL
jgi:hypothetical protein